MSAWIQHFFAEVLQTKPLEWWAALFGFVSVLFAQRNHVFLYPSGLISTGIYAFLWSRKEAGLYAEAALNLYYFVMSVYGWWYWQKGGTKPNHQERSISKCSRKEWVMVLFLVLFLWVIFGYLLLFTDSQVILADSFVSASACAGMWLLARRKIENWILLNCSNLVSIPLFIFKGYYVTTLLTLILFIVAIFGYIRWRNIYQREQLED